MIRILIRRFVPDYENKKDPAVRSSYAMLAGVLGILCNLLLFAVKLIIGTLMNSIAITSDAFNNLSDLGASLIAAVSAKLAGQRPDNDHPFGHGRLEYIASLAVSFLIMLVGVELFRTSFDKLLHPEELNFHLVPLLILVLSMSVKVWMWSYNRFIAKETDSTVLAASAADSINDVMATSAVVLATVLGLFLPAKIPVDGIMGIIVSLLILRAGFGIAKETVGLLLGAAPDPEMVKALERTVLSGEHIVDVHDLMIHDYGPGRQFASVHAEVPSTVDIMAAHEEIDFLEQKVMKDLGVVMVIHMDPIVVGNEKVDGLKAMAETILKEVNPLYTLHDFRITDGEEHINLIFDIVAPMNEKPEVTAEHVGKIRERICEENPMCSAVIKVDLGIVED
ncbi:MAG: cation diffusion facilitator family transporter [Clostridia bacterium]|nr:cation diffusion facilitator family transporter [Clostridia bacterium]